MRAMKHLWLLILFLSAGAVLAVLLAQTQTAQTAKPAKRKTVVVELFTSEGCSSCPSADVLLSRLRQEKMAEGVEVVPLGLHVDYWNYLGWTDRFSSEAYSLRQQKYAESFRINGPYTPQMVVDGAWQFTGSNSSQAHQAILEAAQRPQQAEIHIAPAQPDKWQIQATCAAGVPGEVMLAVTEDNLATKVRAGENGGRELRHAAVVRQLRSLGTVRDGNFNSTVSLNLPKDWKRDDLRIVVFVQNPATESIEGAATLPVAAN